MVKLREEFNQITFPNVPIYFTDTMDIIKPSDEPVKEMWYTDSTSQTFYEMYASLKVKEPRFFDCDNLIVCNDWKKRYKVLQTKYDDYIKDLNVDQGYVETIKNYPLKAFLNMKPS